MLNSMNTLSSKQHIWLQMWYYKHKLLYPLSTFKASKLSIFQHYFIYKRIKHFSLDKLHWKTPSI